MIRDALEHLAKMRPEKFRFVSAAGVEPNSILTICGGVFVNNPSSDDCDEIAAELGWEFEVCKTYADTETYRGVSEVWWARYWKIGEGSFDEIQRTINASSKTKLAAAHAALESIIFTEFAKEKP